MPRATAHAANNAVNSAVARIMGTRTAAAAPAAAPLKKTSSTDLIVEHDDDVSAPPASSDESIASSEEIVAAPVETAAPSSSPPFSLGEEAGAVPVDAPMTYAGALFPPAPIASELGYVDLDLPPSASSSDTEEENNPICEEEEEEEEERAALETSVEEEEDEGEKDEDASSSLDASTLDLARRLEKDDEMRVELLRRVEQRVELLLRVERLRARAAHYAPELDAPAQPVQPVLASMLASPRPGTDAASSVKTSPLVVTPNPPTQSLVAARAGGVALLQTPTPKP